MKQVVYDQNGDRYNLSTPNVVLVVLSLEEGLGTIRSFQSVRTLLNSCGKKIRMSSLWNVLQSSPLPQVPAPKHPSPPTRPQTNNFS